MAGDWIPMRVDLADDPDVIAIGDATGLESDVVVGKLHRLWSWASRHLENGHARVTLASRSCPDGDTGMSWIDHYLGVRGFSVAMQNVGWLEVTEGGFTIPKWNVHNSKSAKSRLLATRRKQAGRSQNGHAVVVTKTSLDKREDKRDIKNPYSPRDGDAAPPPKAPTTRPYRRHLNNSGTPSRRSDGRTNRRHSGPGPRRRPRLRRR